MCVGARLMRPASEIRMDLAAALVDGGGTTRQLAQRTGWAIGMTMTALDNMARAGQVHKRLVRVPGVKRWVPFYERAPLHADVPQAPHLSLIAAWSAAPARARVGVGM
jgi:hypothetical protein